MNDAAQTVGLILAALGLGSIIFGWLEYVSLLLLKYFPPGMVIARFSRPFALRENNIHIGQVIETEHGKYAFLNRETCLCRRGYTVVEGLPLKGVLRFADDTLTFEVRLPIGILMAGLIVLLAIVLWPQNISRASNDITPLGFLFFFGWWCFVMWFVFEKGKENLIEVYHEVQEAIGGDAAAG